jgi:hypothetical protein
MYHKFSPPPYSYIAEVNLNNGPWSPPPDVVVCEVRCKSAGTVAMRTRTMAAKNKSSKRRRYNEYDIDRIDVATIYPDGTSTNLYKNQLTVAGHYISDLSGA